MLRKKYILVIDIKREDILRQNERTSTNFNSLILLFMKCNITYLNLLAIVLIHKEKTLDRE